MSEKSDLLLQYEKLHKTFLFDKECLPSSGICFCFFSGFGFGLVLFLKQGLMFAQLA